ncbi:MAG TPA: dTDP-glucose 4,6-dehydratase [Candidatus Micrarchaeia archaeon]|nr:dTDP-glucose 4,6-dehydratase [Candidatus Micrarchaeia archaeon]
MEPDPRANDPTSGWAATLPRRLVVTGGAGFIGSAFVRLVLQLADPPQVTVLDALTYAGNLANLAQVAAHPRYTFVHGNICDAAAVEPLAAAADCIVNFAAESHVDRSILDPGAFIQTDVYGTFVLLEAARRHQHPRFLQVSTDEVYGDVAAPHLSQEGDPPRPRSPYAASKVGGEMQCWAYHETFGVPVLITRGSNTYGPYQYPEKIIPLFVTNALEERPLPIYGGGTAVRDYLHVDDHARGIAMVLAQGQPGEVYNIGQGDDPVDGLTIARTVLRLTGRGERLMTHVQDRPGHDRRYALDTARMRRLGWAPTRDLGRGLEETVRWYEQRRDWWEPIKSGAFWEFYRRNYRPLAGATTPP